ncbi:MAG: 1-deoxy-D-xylulose-5-phosphate synthase [Thermovirgaceae bacterium]|nr:1-deoxy-D-xylulose-5-phosphate synthase [Synergistales bacterium]MDY0178448.1 1-deoxy-D-xylulose-5-phosphate synthase [Synergistaceae bacterium]
MRELLDRIVDHRDLKELDYRQLDSLAEEIRETIVGTVQANGGHLASSLGAVELNIALLRAFDPSRDRIVFDVGHQAYAYKILTGRKDQFHTLRRWGGVSGFPDPRESPFDHFNAGHSSKSLSAALGLAKARDLLGRRHTVAAVIGDGSLINGLALEALNHAHELKTPVLFILNDNQMSINRRVGGLANHLAALSVNPMYRQFKKLLKFFCRKVPDGRRLESFLERSKQTVKGLLLPPNMFEDLGISYWGPFDGHNIQEMEKIFDMAKSYESPLLIHLLTVKGKGFRPAEEDPERFHGVSPGMLDMMPSSTPEESWSEASAACVEELADRDPRVVLMTAAMKEGSRLNRFCEKYPERFFDVGIAEGHLLTFAAGIAAAGMVPVVSVYSTFLQRAMDQLVHDICMQDLHVILAIDRAGLVGEDGETHHGVLDLPWTRTIPNLAVMAPRDRDDLRWMYQEALKTRSPSAIRLPRGQVPVSMCREGQDFPREWGRSEKILDGTGWCIFSYGATVPLAVRTYEETWRTGVEPPSVYDLRFLKPLDTDTIMSALSSHLFAVVIEDSNVEGGIGEKISSLANRKGLTVRVESLGVPDRFVPHGTVREQWEYCGLVPGEVIGLYEIFRKRGKTGSGNGRKGHHREQEPGPVVDTGRIRTGGRGKGSEAREEGPERFSDRSR